MLFSNFLLLLLLHFHVLGGLQACTTMPGLPPQHLVVELSAQELAVGLTNALASMGARMIVHACTLPRGIRSTV